MVILGIDPGLETIGFGIIKKNNNSLIPLDFGIITTSSKEDFPTRLVQISTDIEHILKQYKPKLVAIERLFFGTNITNAISVAHCRGVLILQTAKRGIPIKEYSPNEVKSLICGFGKADKLQIQNMLKHHLNLDHPPKPDDAADALSLAICGSFEV